MIKDHNNFAIKPLISLQNILSIEKLSHDHVHLVHIDDNQAEIQQIISLIKNKTNFDFSLYKQTTTIRCIQKRMQILQLNTFTAYIYYLYQHSHEITLLFKNALIHVTSFFRDIDAFELLKQELLKRITKSDATDKVFRVWIPACSTGEEAYSIAIILQECLTELNTHINVRIFATDADMSAIEKARKGIFPKSIENHVSVKRLEAFFVKQGNTYKIKKYIRETLVFAVQNIIENPPFAKLNLLCCRNVLIYLNLPLQNKIFLTFHRALENQGLLFLGSAENISHSSPDLFTTINSKWRIFERKHHASISLVTTRSFSMNTSIQHTDLNMIQKVTNQREHKLNEIINEFTSTNYTPAFIFVDASGNIVYLHGTTNKFLALADGDVCFNIASMIKPELKLTICNALQKASHQQVEIKLGLIQLTDNDQHQYINVIIRPMNNNIETDDTKLFLIIIEELNFLIPSDMDKSAHFSCKNFQQSIDNLEESHEELTSFNEEIQATNEELQSLNESLLSTNLMLENRLESLLTAYNDIKNLLDHTDIATICVDQNLCIKHYTPPATHLINLISTDIGRPIYHLLSNLHYKELINDVRMVIKMMEPIDIESTDYNGDNYLIKIIPYRCCDNMISGAVLTFLNKSKINN